jgi:catechol 2,3-dioxygenase-like lactoylglutathione lyase family enzyme
MSTSTRPPVECARHHAGLSVSDVAAAVDFYVDSLGFSAGFTSGDPPTFAGVTLGETQIFLQQGKPSPDGLSVYFLVDHADPLCEYQRARGVEIIAEPGDRAYGLRDYTVRDLHGYRLTFGHPIFTMGPPIEIERVDVPVRLEKRLAALLVDLAAHKRMTISSCLEETLLHTFEPYGDSVASPHTKSDLRFIQELRKKHGIDYDSHGSYRFVERADSDRSD